MRPTTPTPAAGRPAARVLLAGLLSLAAAGSGPLAGAAAAPSPAAQPAPPVAVFADLEGTWSGTFVAYDLEGRELYRLRSRQTYTTLDATTQRVEIADTFADGRVVTGRGENVARRLADGSLELGCRVEKSDGDRVEHRGTVVRGPDGDPQLLWLTDRPDRQEMFRERVQREGSETLYLIDGLGRYGETAVLMAGRYRKLDD